MNKPASHRTRWILVLVVVALAFGLALMRALDKRREAAAAASAPTATSAAALELLPGDLVQALPRELVATVAVSGGLQAVDSAIVKAKVAG
ncbi:MAG TPA: efflux transporter periplasmic adaptor subunit, partial [Rubrivivax sp.]|nr:efflux transporter periplasmic adaptor subunit [Rubrivivax sp.]